MKKSSQEESTSTPAKEKKELKNDPRRRAALWLPELLHRDPFRKRDD